MTTASFIAWMFMNTMLVADWGQTRVIATQQTGPYWHNTSRYAFENKSEYMWEERNPLLGKRPSMGRVNEYFAGALLFHNTAYFLIPKKYRNYYAVGVGAFEAGFVVSNHTAGIRIRF